jgi:uncharacterized protein YggT (Ycf19 family)
MINFELFNNLNPLIGPVYKNEVFVFFVHSLSVFLLNAVSYFYIFLKFFKVLCYSKMTFEWLPMINPYVWPFSIFNVLTSPYFGFWSRVLPSIKLERTSVEISGIIAVEALNSVVFFCIQATNYLVLVLDQLEEKILNDIN